MTLLLSWYQDIMISWWRWEQWWFSLDSLNIWRDAWRPVDPVDDTVLLDELGADPHHLGHWRSIWSWSWFHDDDDDDAEGFGVEEDRMRNVVGWDSEAKWKLQTRDRTRTYQLLCIAWVTALKMMMTMMVTMVMVNDDKGRTKVTMIMKTFVSSVWKQLGQLCAKDRCLGCSLLKIYDKGMFQKHKGVMLISLKEPFLSVVCSPWNCGRRRQTFHYVSKQGSGQKTRGIRNPVRNIILGCVSTFY